MNRFLGSERDWTAQYAAVGQFVVEFEWICWALRHHGCILLQMHGLKKWQLGEIIFHQRSFTAEPLFACYCSLVAECLGSDHPLIKELSSFRSPFQELCKLRNDLLHASYLIGDSIVEITDKESPTEVHVERRTPDKSGWRFQSLATSLAELNAYGKQAAEMKERFNAFLPRVMVALHELLVAGQPQSAGGSEPTA